MATCIGKETTNRQHWAGIARRRGILDVPWIPHASDVEYFFRQISNWQAENGAPSLTALILGVTPAFALMPWPDEFRVSCIDNSTEMISKVWPCHGQAKRHVIGGDWNDLPIREGTADIIICDGGFALFPYPDGFRHLFGELARALRTGGLLIVRFFAQSIVKPDLDEIFRQLVDGEISSFQAFKLKLNLALQETAEAGGRLGNTWDCWAERHIDTAELAAERNWPMSEFRSLEISRDSDVVLFYPTLGEIRSVAKNIFQELDCQFHAYQGADNCPTVCFRKAD